MRVHWGVRNLPRFDKQKDGGDDGWFISEESQSAGVADGVGAWRKRNINPGIYTRSLMAITKNPHFICCKLPEIGMEFF